MLEKLLGAAGGWGDVLMRCLLALVCGMLWGWASHCRWGGLGEIGGTQPKPPVAPLHSWALPTTSPKRSSGVAPLDPMDIAATEPEKDARW